MKFETDYVGRNEQIPTGTKEILVGETNRPESVGVHWSDYRIASVNGRVVIGGGCGSVMLTSLAVIITATLGCAVITKKGKK